jgi:predicted dehydrogenase
VLAEKPLTLKLSESQALCDLAQQQQRQLVIDHTYLFHPVVETGQQVIAKGKLGDLRYGYAARTHLEPVRPDVDALWDLAIHDIAIFNTWLGQTPIQVQATGTVWLQPDREFETDRIQDLTPISNSGLSDIVMATLTYPNGFRAFLHLCWLNPDKQRRLGVVGSEGTLIF